MEKWPKMEKMTHNEKHRNMACTDHENHRKMAFLASRKHAKMALHQSGCGE